MCTLDPLGFASNQYCTVPFLVLHKALDSYQESKTESKELVLKLVKETCVNIVKNNSTLKE